MSNWEVRHGDCRDVMRSLPPESVDAIVSDPPYGLSFMGKEWDHGVPGVEFWTEALRVAKPGAHLVAFGGTRTYHRLAVAIEDAGWEVRDCLSWLYGSGFPKSLDVSKAMDKTAGVEREVIGYQRLTGTAAISGDTGRASVAASGGSSIGAVKMSPITAPATDAAKRWHGWGTALKPAWEPIILARKPITGTVAANVTQYGTGAINVDGCRIGTEVWTRKATGNSTPYGSETTWSTSKTPDIDRSGVGRWPANVCLDEDAAAVLGEPSRFFYTAKVSRREREAGLDGMPKASRNEQSAWIRECKVCGDRFTDVSTGKPKCGHDDVGYAPPSKAANHHPTVKPIALMRWLCRLVTPPGGLILDPFNGSGSTGCAAVLEGFRYLGAELEAEYVEIARRRIAYWEAQRAEPDLFG